MASQRTDTTVIPFRQPRIKLPKSLPKPFEPWRNERCWVCWEFRWDAEANHGNGDWRKPPLQTNGELAKPNNPEHFVTYDRAYAAAKKNGWGVGISLNFAELPGMDLDKSRDPATGEALTDSAQTVLDMAKGAYVEVSATGRGWHVIGLGKGGDTPGAKCPQEGESAIEVYRNRVRYFTLTGEQVGHCEKLTYIDEPIDWVIGNHRGGREKPTDKKPDKSTSGKFHAKVCKLFERGKDDDWIEEHIEGHLTLWKKTKADVFEAQGRLRGEIERCREAWEADNSEEAARRERKPATRKWGKPTKANLIEPRDLNWISYPWIAEEEMFWIVSRGGVGKGLTVADLVARMTTGEGWPFKNRECGDPCNVYWFESEDNLDTTIVPRLIAAGADLDKVSLVERTPKEFWKLTTEELKEKDIGMVVLSPLLSYLEIENFRDEIEVRNQLEKMSDMIRGIACTTVGLLHPNKKDGLEAVERILGSVAFANFVRSMVMLRDEGDGLSRMAHVKYNLSVKGDDLLFTKRNTQPLKHARGQYIAIDWQKAKDNADESTLLDRITKKDNAPTAAEWLENFLGDGQWHTCDEIFKAGLEAAPKPHNEKTLTQAKKRNDDIEHDKRGFPAKVKWRLRRRSRR